MEASSSSWGPFARKRGALGAALVRGAPAPAVVACACCSLALFLVAVVFLEGSSFDGSSSSSSPSFKPFSDDTTRRRGASGELIDLSDGSGGGGGGGGSRRRLQQWLAPIWYSLPTLFDSLYNLGEAITDLGITPYEYQLAEELNAAVKESGINDIKNDDDDYLAAINNPQDDETAEADQYQEEEEDTPVAAVYTDDDDDEQGVPSSTRFSVDASNNYPSSGAGLTTYQYRRMMK